MLSWFFVLIFVLQMPPVLLHSPPSHLRACLLAILLASSLLSCQATRKMDRTLTAPENAATLDASAPFLKAHLTGGNVVVFSDWVVPDGEEVVRGSGTRLGPNRDTLAQGPMRVPLAEVALFETNTTRPSGSIAALSVVTGASLILTAVCAANPKACFGSCPTFYAPTGTAASDTLLQAEGFSSSIAPSLEKTDVDALARTGAADSTFTLRMTNEALETHVVRAANLLVVPRPDGGRAFQISDGTFWTARSLQAPAACSAPEGDCRSLVAALDGAERFSLADSTDLAATETITLRFDDMPDGPLGLVVGARQTLMTTFLLYQTLAYMGTDVGTWLAMLERGDGSLRDASVRDVLGGIEVRVPTANGGWQTVGEAGEHGPLATDTHLIRLPALPDSTTTLQLRLTKGNWRLDHLALADLDAPAAPLRVAPATVRRDGRPAPDARAQLLDSTRTLVTLPGDAYTFTYRLPVDGAGHELFLESRGYYLEWMRDAWLEETDPDRVAAMLFAPERMLKTLAPAFKAVEPEMESAFWNSRYER